MTFQTITFDIDDGFTIAGKKEIDMFYINITHNNQSIGQVMLVTDFVDVECITSIQLDEHHAKHIFLNGHLLAEVVVKFVLKFSPTIRKPEFRFILNAPEYLKPVFENYHLSYQDSHAIIAHPSILY